MKITIIDPNGSISNGNILNVNGNCFNFTVGEDRIIQGAPILNENFNVVGIYCGLCDASNENPNKTCTAINICSILDAHNKFLIRTLNGKTDSEYWLEKINLLQKNDFQHIGSGGFGQVFKIKLETEFAVKIVGGVGQLSDYKCQVRALEKEYEIVCSLDNHPRIIIFLLLSMMLLIFV